MATDWALCQQLAQQNGEQHGVPWNILRSLWESESTCDPSRTGPRTRYGYARGLGQLLDSTARSLGVRNPLVDSYDAETNADASARYLRQLYDQFGSWDLALAGYHAGPGAVMAAHGIPNTSDGLSTTGDYVRGILNRAARIVGAPSPFPATGGIAGGSSGGSSSGSSSAAQGVPPGGGFKSAINIHPEFRTALILGTGALLIAMAVLRTR